MIKIRLWYISAMILCSVFDPYVYFKTVIILQQYFYVNKSLLM